MCDTCQRRDAQDREFGERMTEKSRRNMAEIRKTHAKLESLAEEMGIELLQSPPLKYPRIK